MGESRNERRIAITGRATDCRLSQLRHRHSFYKVNRMRILLLVIGLAVLSSRVLAADVPRQASSNGKSTDVDLTNAGDILQKSEAAYAAVKTYVGTTTVRGKADFGVMNLEQTSSAKVSFVRPGKIRIEGRTAGRDPAGRDGQPFTILSDGTTTWRSWAIQNGGAYSVVQNIPMAGMAGVAQGSVEGIPAALMKSDGAWTGGHDPYAIPRMSQTAVAGREKIDGADCYKLVAKNPKHADVTLWIDSKSFLLR